MPCLSHLKVKGLTTMDMKFTHISYDLQQLQMTLSFLFTDPTYKGEPNKLVYVTWEDGEITDVDSPDDRILEYIASSPTDMVMFLNTRTMKKLIPFCQSMIERVKDL